MTYVAYIEYYREWDEKMTAANLFITANTLTEAVNKLSSYYGEEYLERIDIKSFSPDDFIIFKDENTELFNAVKSAIEPDIIW